jgi:uncharacterized membrane protein YozB (DUF420 family)
MNMLAAIDAQTLPAINATLNSLSTILLIVGYVLIRRGKWREHGYVMAAALVSSAVFLVGYLAHKAMYPNFSIVERFPNLAAGWRYFYWFAVLIPHLILAVGMLPFIGLGLWHAYKRDWARHRRINRWTLPIWLYVSVTGVLIYWLLYHLFPTLNARA